ncbi:hypothetical protein KUF55_08915 [Paeniglutamicibacter sp. Y32M11]|nr:hypothetical protein KUF55_08915 [Paeniglutamicibacter sp. Y32M11]
MSPALRKETVVGMIADPGLPMALARRLKVALENFLGQELDNDTNWVVETEDFSLPVDRQGEVELTIHASQLKDSYGWDYVVYLTDLPKYEHGEPLISSVNAASGSAVVVLPSLGFLRKRRLIRAVLQVLAVLHGVRDPYLLSGGRVSPRTDPLQVERRIEAADVNDDAFETAKGWRGRALLLLGMVRSNRPWRLVPSLSTAMAAAVATGAFGVFYTSIWSMADFLPPLRLALISIMSVLIMGSWLVLHNGLWELPTGGPQREKRVIYNLATLVTIFAAVLLMYLALFLVILAGSLIIIDNQYLAMQLDHEVGLAEYVNLSWLAASLGTVAGAVGSSLDDEESVRRATFSRREFERRQITLAPGKEREG